MAVMEKERNLKLVSTMSKRKMQTKISSSVLQSYMPEKREADIEKG